jgi:ABC-type branched-subunit amino acid transport system substrate-binding protein
MCACPRGEPGRIRTRASAALAAGLALCALAAPTAAQERPVESALAVEPVLRIGLLVGRDDPLAASLERGARLALAQASAARAFELRVARLESPWASAADHARDLIHVEDCVALIAPPDREVSHQAALVVSRAHVPLVTLSRDSTLTRAGSPWVFRSVPDDRAQLAALVAGLSHEPARVAALVPWGRAGSPVRADLVFLSGRSGVAFDPVVAVGDAPPAEVLEPLLALRDAPLVIWLPEAQSQPLLEAAASLGWRGPVLMPGSLGRPPSAAVRAGLQIHAGQPLGGGPNPCDTRFRESFLQAFECEPDAAAACAFDAATLLARALEAAGGEPADARAWLAEPREHTGVTMPFRLDAVGNRREAWPVASPSPLTAPRPDVPRSDSFLPGRRSVAELPSLPLGLIDPLASSVSRSEFRDPALRPRPGRSTLASQPRSPPSP